MKLVLEINARGYSSPRVPLPPGLPGIGIDPGPRCLIRTIMLTNCQLSNDVAWLEEIVKAG